MPGKGTAVADITEAERRMRALMVLSVFRSLTKAERTELATRVGLDAESFDPEADHG
jgi:hypothetical protein